MHKRLWIGLLLGLIVYGASCASVQAQPSAGNAQKGEQARALEAAIEQIEDIPTNTLRGELAALYRKQGDGRLTASERERIPKLETEIDLRDAGTADLSGGSLSNSTTNLAR
jgi:hypothetical protein